MDMQHLAWNRTVSARLLAVIVAIVGAILLRATFAGTAGGGGLPPITVAVMLVWFIGGTAVLAVVGRGSAVLRVREATHDARQAGHAWQTALSSPPKLLSGRPVLCSVTVGTAFSVMCVVGALVLAEIPLTSEWVNSALHTAQTGIGVVFATAVVTGAAEEVFFRIGLRALIPDAWYVVGSTAAYGVVTAATGNGALVLASLLLGLVAAQIYRWYGRWYAPIIIHALWTVGVIGVFPALSST